VDKVKDAKDKILKTENFTCQQHDNTVTIKLMQHFYYYCIRLTASFQDNLGRPAPERLVGWLGFNGHQKGKPFWILLEPEMMGWQWHQLDHMQIICTSLQTDNHTSTSPLSFYGTDALPAAQPTASKH